MKVCWWWWKKVLLILSPLSHFTFSGKTRKLWQDKKKDIYLSVTFGNRVFFLRCQAELIFAFSGKKILLLLDLAKKVFFEIMRGRGKYLNALLSSFACQAWISRKCNNCAVKICTLSVSEWVTLFLNFLWKRHFRNSEGVFFFKKYRMFSDSEYVL